MINTYSIKELEHLSGIKAHTLRIWEQRYKLLNPKRTATNIRNYSGEDLKKLLKISLLNKNGFKISRIANMSNPEMEEQVINLMSDTSRFDLQITALTNSMIELNEDRFEEIINFNIESKGFEPTILELVYPFLNKIGYLWMSGSINPAQEHFMTNLIRQKIISEINTISVKANYDKPSFVLYLPEGELHEIGLLFCHYLLKSRSFPVTYLGASTPVKDLMMVVNYKEIQNVFGMCICYPQKKKLQKHMDELGKKLPNTQIYLTGMQCKKINFPISNNIKILDDASELMEIIENSSTGES